ncbi:hypothetical protein [Sulfobacillus sp. hq2]|uniref:hypothetical protein n=1 Tax=Sulfobacillus TaxID=28033 RepID=UPI000CD27694|nr:hypothetical protein [Sulfobacillus sp. hq2]POB12229.1 hypothetical protein CO251_00280 [Sulfobacillus sp. hq2]
MRVEVLLAEAGFSEHGRVKGYAWHDTQSLDIWYCLPNTKVAEDELTALVASIQGTLLNSPLNGGNPSKAHCARRRVLIAPEDSSLSYACSNYASFH